MSTSQQVRIINQAFTNGLRHTLEKNSTQRISTALQPARTQFPLETSTSA
jgi:hypothetical protein